MEQEIERDEQGYLTLRDGATYLGYVASSFNDERVLRRLGLRVFRIAATGAKRLRKADVMALVVAEKD